MDEKTQQQPPKKAVVLTIVKEADLEAFINAMNGIIENDGAKDYKIAANKSGHIEVYYYKKF